MLIVPLTVTTLPHKHIYHVSAYYQMALAGNLTQNFNLYMHVHMYVYVFPGSPPTGKHQQGGGRGQLYHMSVYTSS